MQSAHRRFAIDFDFLAEAPWQEHDKLRTRAAPAQSELFSLLDYDTVADQGRKCSQDVPGSLCQLCNLARSATCLCSGCSRSPQGLTCSLAWPLNCFFCFLPLRSLEFQMLPECMKRAVAEAAGCLPALRQLQSSQRPRAQRRSMNWERDLLPHGLGRGQAGNRRLPPVSPHVGEQDSHQPGRTRKADTALSPSKAKKKLAPRANVSGIHQDEL